MESWTLFERIAAGAGLVTILGGLFVAMRWGRARIRAFWHRLTRFKPTIPRETIRVVPGRKPWWHMGSQGGQPAMQISTDWLATNISENPTMVANAFMSRGWFRRAPEAQRILDKTLPVGVTAEVSVDFWVHPPFRKKGESFNTRLTLVDHLGNRHKTRRFTIPSDWRPKLEEPQPDEEVVHRISDAVVKQVVVVLKDEITRYRECGRKAGGLGSVQVTYENRTLNGIGYQGRKSNSPRRQWVIPDPENASLHSDNLDSIMNIFAMQDEARKQLIVGALLQRITLGSEYTPIGYFFLFALFRMGHLPKALQAIKHGLIEDEKFGFDDAVKMLSGLLQYEYPNFDEPALDEVERFIDGLGGPKHHLKERCIAARAANYEAKNTGTK